MEWRVEYQGRGAACEVFEILEGGGVDDSHLIFF